MENVEIVEDLNATIKKVKLPYFNGNDASSWISRAETFFQIKEVSYEIKLKLAKLGMEGAAMHWFNLWSVKAECLTWQEFKAALMVRFGGFKVDNPFVNLSDLKQITQEMN